MITPSELQRKRVVLNFDAKYEDQGGVDQLISFAKKYTPLREIAEHFGLSIPRTSSLLAILLGETYEEYQLKGGVRNRGRRL